MSNSRLPDAHRSNTSRNWLKIDCARCAGAIPRQSTDDIRLNHQYLTQYVKSIESETVSMKLFPKAISEVVVFDAFRYQHLLMPLRD